MGLTGLMDCVIYGLLLSNAACFRTSLYSLWIRVHLFCHHGGVVTLDSASHLVPGRSTYILHM